MLVPSAYAGEIESFAVYYSDKAAKFDSFDLLVFDSDYHPLLAPLSDDGKTLLGYISLGEVENHRYYFDKTAQYRLHENQNWKGSYYVDIRDERWIKLVIENLVPSILHEGFDGIFLDTLDNPIELENTDPDKYKGMKKAAANLVKGIRLHYPNIKIMMNRGYEILPELSSTIDMELGESVYADYDFETKAYSLVEKNLYLEQVKLLKNSGVKVFTLDYWNKNDTEGISRIYKEQAKNGFIPYVSTISLDEIVGAVAR